MGITTNALRVFSDAGGPQSTSVVVLAAQWVIDFPVFVFANTGHDCEDTAILSYLDRIARPFATTHGIELHALDRIRRDGSIETLFGRLTCEGSRSLPIPVRMSSGGRAREAEPPTSRLPVIGRWLKAHGASASRPATVHNRAKVPGRQAR
jgi:hypothetical protein